MMAMHILRPSALKQVLNSNYGRRYFCVLTAAPVTSSYDAAQTITRGIHTLTHGIIDFKARGSAFSSIQSLQISRQYTTKDEGFFLRLIKKIGLAIDSKALLRVDSYRLYEEVADRVQYPQFFQKFDLPNTFHSWFLVTELHVWMLMVRAMSENKETAQLIRDSIIEAMWTDVQDRARKLPGVRRNIINEQVNLLNQQFQYSLIALDEGLLTDDKTLASAVWKRIFEADCEDYRLIELLIVYIRKTTLRLDAMSTEEFLQKRSIKWYSLAEIENEIDALA